MFENLEQFHVLNSTILEESHHLFYDLILEVLFHIWVVLVIARHSSHQVNKRELVGCLDQLWLTNYVSREISDILVLIHRYVIGGFLEESDEPRD